jgi:streptogramin lyase
MRKIGWSGFFLVLFLLLSSCVLYESKEKGSFEEIAITETILINPYPTETQDHVTTPYITTAPIAIEKTNFIHLPYEEEQWISYSVRADILDEPEKRGEVILGSITFSQDGNAWMKLSGESSIIRFEDGEWTTYTSPFELWAGGFNSLAVDPDGSVWLAAWDGVFQFDGKDWKTHSSFRAMDILVTPDSTVWITHEVLGTSETAEFLYRGVSYYDGGYWHAVIDKTDDVFVNNIAISPDGVIWIGTNSSGIFRFFEDVWTHFDLDTFPEYPMSGGGYTCAQCVRTFAVAPNGTLWAMLVSAGLVHFDGERWNTYPYYMPEGYGIVTAIAANNEGKVWVGESLGRVVSFIEDEQWYTFSNLPFSIVYDIEIAPDGTVWISAKEGLYLYKE